MCVDGKYISFRLLTFFIKSYERTNFVYLYNWVSGVVVDVDMTWHFVYFQLIVFFYWSCNELKRNLLTKWGIWTFFIFLFSIFTWFKKKMWKYDPIGTVLNTKLALTSLRWRDHCVIQRLHNWTDKLSSVLTFVSSVGICWCLLS